MNMGMFKRKHSEASSNLGAPPRRPAPPQRVIAEDEFDSECFLEIHPHAITVAIFCALTHESVAVRYTLDQHFICRPILTGPSNFVFSFGRIGNHHVVIARPVRMGPVNAAHCAAAIHNQFPTVRLALMVGIGGGIPNPPKQDIRLGDVVVSIPRNGNPGVIHHDKVTHEKDQVVLRGHLKDPPEALLNADALLQREEKAGIDSFRRNLSRLAATPMFRRPVTEDFLFDDSFSHVNKRSDCRDCYASGYQKLVPRIQRRNNQPVVHRGLILSGGTVVKSPRARRDLQRGFQGALCFEMEAAGIMDHIPCLVVRGICDYADTHKQDAWQYHAAAVAAAYCRTLLEKLESQHMRP